MIYHLHFRVEIGQIAPHMTCMMHNISSSNAATSGATNLYRFYILSFEHLIIRVYKVLDNNGGTAYSGAEPTSESTSPFELVDMY